MAAAEGERRKGERRTKPGFVLRERRTGFDRRQDPRRSRHPQLERILLALRGAPHLLALVLVGANLLNALDLLLTVNALRNGAVESNPIMDAFLQQGFWTAAAFKLGLVGLISLMVWRLRRYRTMLAGSLVLLVSFGVVFSYQVVGLLLFL